MSHRQGSGNSLGYFNLARGLGMLLILLGHSMTPFLTIAAPGSRLFSGAGSVFGGGMMAMFFFISGFCFFRRSPRKCLSIQAKLLLLPYGITATAILVTKFLLSILRRRPFGMHGGELLLTYLLGLNAEGGGTFLGFRVDSVSIFWFVLALFGGWILYNGILQLQSTRLQWILICGCVILSYLLALISPVWPYCLPMMLLAVGYLAAGSQIRKHGLLDRNLPVWAWVLILSIALLSAAFGEVSIVTNTWKLGLLDVAGSFCAGFLLLRLYARLVPHIRQNVLTHMVESIGFYSIWIVCLHAYEKCIFPWYRLRTLFPDSPALCIVICFLGRLGIIYLLYLLVSMIYRKYRKIRLSSRIRIDL